MDVASLMVRVEGDVSDAEGKLKSLNSGISDFASSAAASGKALSLAWTAPLAAAGAGVFKLGSDFESAFAGVVKTVDAPQAVIDGLRESILEMGEVLPATVNEIADVMAMGGQLGIDTSNLESFTRTMIDLGESTNLTSEQAATDLAQLANITQMPQEQFSNLGSVIVALGNNLATTEADIVSFGMRIAGAGAQVGLTEAQIMGLAGAYTSVGINAEAGGTAVSKVLAEMNTAVMSSSEELSGFAEIANMTTTEFAELFKRDAAEALTVFTEGLARMKDEGVDVTSVLEELGFADRRLLDTLLRSAGAGNLMRRSLELANEAWDENTALTEEAETRYATMASQIAIVINQLRGLAVGMYDMVRPQLEGVVGGVGDFLGGIREMVQGLGDLDPRLVSAALAFGAVIAAAGPLLLLFSGIATAIGLLLTPVGAITVAIAGLAAAWASDFMGIRTTVQNVINAVRPHFETLLGWISSASKGDWGPLKEGLQGALNAVQLAVQEFAWDAYITALDWGAYIGTLAWGGYVKVLSWVDYVKDINWRTFVSDLLWNVYIASFNWDDYLTNLLWEAYVFTLRWADWLSPLAWKLYVASLDWGGYIEKFFWKAYITAVAWEDYIANLTWGDVVAKLSDWGEYIANLTWDDVITKITDWGTYIPKIGWSNFVSNLVWRTYISSLSWTKHIEPIFWSLYIKSLDWEGVVSDIAWDLYVTAVNWQERIPELLWKTYVTVLVWENRIAKLSWGDFVTALTDWGQYLATINWSHYISGLVWGAHIKAIDWGSYVKALLWSAYVKSLDWSPFVSGLVWRTYVTAIKWSDYITTLTWKTYVNVLTWENFVENLSWDDFVVGTLEWTGYVYALGWNAFIKILEWATFVPRLVWSQFVKVLTWENVMKTTISWADFVPKLQWGLVLSSPLWPSFIPVLAWGAVIKTVNWSAFIEKLTWSDVKQTTIQWADFITPFRWTTFVPPVAWPVYIPALVWTKFIGPVVWPQFVKVLDWLKFATPLVWNSFVTHANIPDWIPTFSWSDFVEDLSWPSTVIDGFDWGTWVEDLAWPGGIFTFDWNTWISDLEWPTPGEILGAIRDRINSLNPFSGDGGSGAGASDVPTAGDTGEGIKRGLAGFAVTVSEAIVRYLPQPAPVAGAPFLTAPVFAPPRDAEPIKVPATYDFSGVDAAMAGILAGEPIEVPATPIVEPITTEELIAQMAGGGTPEIPVKPTVEMVTTEELIAQMAGGGKPEIPVTPVVEAEDIAPLNEVFIPVTGQVEKVEAQGTLELPFAMPGFQDGLSGAASGIQSAAAELNSFSFEWPPMPTFEWPPLPVWTWPPIDRPAWVWTPVPAPSWLNRLVVPRPSWLGELLSWSPTVKVEGSGTNPGEGQATASSFDSALHIPREEPAVSGSALNDYYLDGAGAGTGGVTVNITMPGMVVRNEQDIAALAEQVAEKIRQRRR